MAGVYEYLKTEENLDEKVHLDETQRSQGRLKNDATRSRRYEVQQQRHPPKRLNDSLESYHAAEDVLNGGWVQPKKRA